MRGKYEMRRLKYKIAELEAEVQKQKDRANRLVRTVVGLGVETERLRTLEADRRNEPKPEFATVWHEGSKSFYHAQLLRQMGWDEVAAETIAAGGEAPNSMHGLEPAEYVDHPERMPAPGQS